MCDYDGDFADLDVRRWRKARKPRQCEAQGCDIGIRVGDMYHETVACNRGERPQRFTHCARCWAICEALWADGAEFIDFALNCGEEWADARTGEQPGHLAFMTADDAQRDLAPKKPGAHQIIRDGDDVTCS